MMQLFRNLQAARRNRRGSVAVEFGLVMPLFIAMFMGMLEYSFVFFTYGSMQAAARDVTRQVAVNTLSVADAADAVKDRLPGWAQGDAQVQVEESDPGNPAANVYVIDVDVPIAHATPFNFYTLSQDSGVHTRVEMKQELPFVQVTP